MKDWKKFIRVKNWGNEFVAKYIFEQIKGYGPWLWTGPKNRRAYRRVAKRVVTEFWRGREYERRRK